MGLDIVIYRNNQKNEVIEISEKLHKAIFSDTNNPLTSSILINIKDYYKTNVLLNQEQIKIFIDDLSKITGLTKSLFADEVSYLVDKLNDVNIIKVHIAGD